jgi:hypothetical protein
VLRANRDPDLTTFQCGAGFLLHTIVATAFAIANLPLTTARTTAALLFSPKTVTALHSQTSIMLSTFAAATMQEN